MLPANTGQGRSIYAHVRSTETTIRLGDGATGTPVTHGAVNPLNGHYYYGGFSGSEIRIYGFNTQTNQSMGLVASGTIPTGGGNGDWAFDQRGRLYIVGGASGTNVVTSIDQQIPAAGPAITVTAKEITRITTPSNENINGIAFGGDGYLYLASGRALFQVNPSTGAVVAQRTLANTGSVDLASCASPNTIVLMKDFPNGRFTVGDQVTLTITGGGITTGNTGTTQGNDSGLQDGSSDEYAGPVFGMTGNTYTITETGPGARSPEYVPTWVCVDENTDRTLASGSGTTGGFTMPPGGTAGVAAVCIFTNAAQIPGISLDKQAGAPSGDAPGATITYRFVVTNTGTVPLATVTVTDPKVGAVTCPPGELAPGASKTCTAAPYVITQGDVDAGAVANTATATGVPSVPGLPTVTDDDSTTTPIDQRPSLALTKTAGTPTDENGSGITDAGDSIQYSFTVTNDGNVGITNIHILDPMVGPVTCDAASLAPGASTSCVADERYFITQGDVLDGEVVNTARARGTASGRPVQSNEASTTTPVQRPDPVLVLEKSAGAPTDVNGSGITDAGDTIQFSFTVTNDGNVPITQVVVDDPRVGSVTCVATSLAPGASTQCVADALYVVTEADELAGAVVNTAVAEGVDPDGGDVTSPPDGTRTPVQTPDPVLSLEKFAADPVDVNGSGITDAGDTIQYSFTVTNDGNVPVTGIVVVDDLAGAVTCVATSLAPGASTQCVADEPYTITDADEDAGVVRNVAVANGVDPDGDPVVSNEDSTTTGPITKPDPRLELDKSAGSPVDVNGSGITDAGDTITFTFVVSNTGNVPLTAVAVSDPKVGAVTCPATTLAPGQSMECTAEAYTVTVEDQQAGWVDNTATATGTTPDGDTLEPTDSTSTPVQTPDPRLALDKQAGDPVDLNNSGLTDAGDTIWFTFIVTNTGNVPVFFLGVDDDMLPGVACDRVVLSVGASTTCLADRPYVITQEDEARGFVRNTAVATAEDPDGGPVESPPDSTQTETQEPVVVLTLDKTAGTPTDVNGSGITDAGDTIQYSFVLTNNGNVPLHALAVDDPLAGSVTCDAASLAPGASTSCVADDVYVITDADESAGSVSNVAVASGVDPNGAPVESNEDETSTPVQTPDPVLVLEKSAGAPTDVNGSGITDAGDTIQFSFTVTNDGNVPITQVVVDDPRVGSVTCVATSLAPGASTQCVADALYVVTEADELAGAVVNTAVAEGVDPDGGDVTSPPDGTRTPVQRTSITARWTTPQPRPAPTPMTTRWSRHRTRRPRRFRTSPLSSWRSGPSWPTRTGTAEPTWASRSRGRSPSPTPATPP